MTDYLTGEAMTDAVHHLAICDDMDELRLKLVCTATKGADCRKYHPDPTVEEWSLDDPDLLDGDICMAVQWAEDGGWETVRAEDGAEFPMIPVHVTLDEGPVLSPVLSRPTLLIQPEPVKPSREDVRQAIEAAFGPTWDSAVEQGLDSAADAVLALLAAQPTVAEVALEDAAHPLDLAEQACAALERVKGLLPVRGEPRLDERGNFCGLLSGPDTHRTMGARAYSATGTYCSSVAPCSLCLPPVDPDDLRDALEVAEAQR